MVRQQANTFIEALSGRISRDVDREDSGRLRSFSFPSRSIGHSRNLLCFAFLLSFSSGNRMEIFIWRYRPGLVIIAVAFLPLSRLYRSTIGIVPPNIIVFAGRAASFRPVLRFRVSVICTLVSRLPFFSLDALRNICPPHSSRICNCMYL